MDISQECWICKGHNIGLKGSTACRHLYFGPKTWSKICWNCLELCSYIFQLACEIKDMDPPENVKYASLKSEIDEGEDFLRQGLFISETLLHINVCVNRHSCRVCWASKMATLIAWECMWHYKSLWVFLWRSYWGNYFSGIIELFAFPQLKTVGTVVFV